MMMMMSIIVSLAGLSTWHSTTVVSILFQIFREPKKDREKHSPEISGH